MNRHSLSRPKRLHSRLELLLGPAAGQNSFCTEVSPKDNHILLDYERSESKERQSLAPMRQVTVRRGVRSSALRLAPTSQSVMGTSLSSPVGSFRTFQPCDLPLRDEPCPWRLKAPKALKPLLHANRHSESELKRERKGPIDPAPILSKEFPGKKVKRKPAIIGHLPYLIRKRLVMTLSLRTNLSLEELT